MLARPFRSDGTSPSGAVCAPAAPPANLPVGGGRLLATAASPAGLSGRKAKVAVHWRSPPKPRPPASLSGRRQRSAGRGRAVTPATFRSGGMNPPGTWVCGRRRLVDPTFPLRRDKPVGGGVRSGSLSGQLARRCRFCSRESSEAPVGGRDCWTRKVCRNPGRSSVN
jgi:hypothetical protein